MCCNRVLPERDRSCCCRSISPCRNRDCHYRYRKCKKEVGSICKEDCFTIREGNIFCICVRNPRSWR